MKNENDILSKIPSDMPAVPYILGYTQAVHDLNKDWDSFRREATKDILCAVLAGGIANGANGFDAQKEELVNVSIGMADELIKQLKEGEE